MWQDTGEEINDSVQNSSAAAQLRGLRTKLQSSGILAFVFYWFDATFTVLSVKVSVHCMTPECWFVKMHVNPFPCLCVYKAGVKMLTLNNDKLL